MSEALVLFANEKTPIGDFSKQVSVAQEAAKLAKEIGMPLLADQDMAKVAIIRAREWCKAQNLKPLSEYDRRTWCMFMPTGYYSNNHVVPEKFGITSWLRDYRYSDGVPLHVRSLMKTAAGIFTTIEIRTVETTPVMSDPALFGHIALPNGTKESYLLARWGESDQNFVTGIDDVVRVLKARFGLEYRTERKFYGESSSFDAIVTRMFAVWGIMIVLVAAGMLLAFSLPEETVRAWKPFALYLLLLPTIFGFGGLLSCHVLRPIRRWNLARSAPHLAKLV